MECWTDRAAVIVHEGKVRLVLPICGGGGGSDGPSQQTGGTTTTTDPWLSKMNELAYGQISQGVQNTGGLPAYLDYNPYALPTEQENALVGQIGQTAAGQGGLDPLEQKGLAGIEKLGDPSQSLDYARGLYEQYAAPIVRNDATIAGQNRGGAVPEALAGGFAKMALPIMERATGAREQLAKEQLDLGKELPGRAITSLETQLRAARAPREALSAEYMRPLQSLASLIGALPPGGGTSSGYQTGQMQSQRADTNWLTDVIVPIAASAAAGYARG